MEQMERTREAIFFTPQDFNTFVLTELMYDRSDGEFQAIF
jgi:hypothetical protein